jgi:hypothetical protein
VVIGCSIEHDPRLWERCADELGGRDLDRRAITIDRL